MMNRTDFIEVIIPTSSEEESDIVISFLADEGYEGFEVNENDLRAFIEASNFDEPILTQVLNRFGKKFTKKFIEGKNWNEEWEKQFEPVIIANKVMIRAAFHPPPELIEYDLIITPKMSFGTGHHATTAMMITQMLAIDFTNKMVLDFGTGTGILSILASKLGAKKVLAIDNDDWSIENAAENIAANNVLNIELQNSSNNGEGYFDIILANINKHVILDYLPAMLQHLNKQGVIILSGLLQTDHGDIERAIKAENGVITQYLSEGEWISLRVNR
jgi:ribosomal protein L11 methyltransferase